MKNFIKKLALVMALALTITTVAPSTVDAASKITYKSGSAIASTIYAGHSYTLGVTGTSVKFYSSDKTVATVGMSTGKLKPVAPGSVTITAKKKTTGKTVATKKFTVLQRSTAVSTDDVTELNLNAKDTATIKATLTPATSTDAVRFYSSDKTVATVGATSGKVTAVANGTATIKVYAKATASTKNSSTANKVATVTVNVGATLDTVAQTATNTIVATFKTDMTGYTLAASDFTITNDETSAVEAVKSVSISGKEVTLTTYNDIKDGKTYTVKYNEKSAQFTATTGTVASLTIDPTTAPIQTLTTIYVVEKDANGVVLGKFKKSELPSNVEMSFTVTDGYTSGDDIYFNSLTSTAVAKATYHTYTYENGTETGKIETGDVAITATAQASVSADGISYSVSKTAVDFTATTYKQNTSIPVDGTDYAVYFKILDSNKKEITDYATYTLSTSNNLVFMVDSVIKADTKSAGIVPVGEGTANIVVKNAAGTVVATLPITVGKTITATTLTFDKSTLTLSNSANLEDAQLVAVTVKDQYSNEVEDYSKLAVSCASVSGTSTAVTASTVTAANGYFSIAGNKITFNGVANGTPVVAGTYYYTISYNDLLKTTYKVVVQAPDTTKASTYAPIISATSVENTVSTIEDKNKTITIALGEYKGGVLVSKTTPDAAFTIDSIKNSAGTDVKSTYYTGAGVINVTSTDTAGITTKLPSGTYTVAMTYTFTNAAGTACESKYNTVLTITDKQPAAVLAQKSLAVTVTGTVADVAKAAFGLTYNGSDYTNWTINTANSTIVNLGTTYVFKTVAVDVTLADGTIVEIPVTVNKSVTVTGTVSSAVATASAAPEATVSTAPETSTTAPETSTTVPEATVSTAPETSTTAPEATVSTAPETSTTVPEASASTTPETVGDPY